MNIQDVRYSISGLTGDQVNLIGSALAELPFKLAAPVMAIINEQVKGQEAVFLAAKRAEEERNAKAETEQPVKEPDDRPALNPAEDKDFQEFRENLHKDRLQRMAEDSMKPGDRLAEHREIDPRKSPERMVPRIGGDADSQAIADPPIKCSHDMIDVKGAE